VFHSDEVVAVRTGGPFIPFRQQWLYYNFEMPAGPIDITGIRFRPKAYTGNISPEYLDLQINLTTTQEMSLGRSFSSNLEASLQPSTNVVDGDVPVQTTRERPPLNPKNFDYELLWETTPFRYDPADGVNLLIDFNSRGGYSAPTQLDSTATGNFQHEGELLHRHLVNWNGNLDYYFRFPITEIVYTPVPENPQHPGDFSNNGVLDINDIDTLTRQAAGLTPDLAFDLTGDSRVDQDDVRYWIHDLFNSWIGDANLDRLFDSADMIAAVSAGQYDDTLVGNSTWSTGDWDGNGEFDSGDLITALSDGGYGAGPRATVSAVPEPASLMLLLPVIFAIARSSFREDGSPFKSLARF
jgi:hypothetical protein